MQQNGKWKIQELAMNVCTGINVYVAAINVTWRPSIGASKIPAESLSHTVSLKCACSLPAGLCHPAADGRGLFWDTWGIGMDRRRGDALEDSTPKDCTIKRLLLLFLVISGKFFLSLAFSPAPFLPSKMGLHGASGEGCFQANLCTPKHPWKSDLCPFCWNAM